MKKAVTKNAKELDVLWLKETLVVYRAEYRCEGCRSTIRTTINEHVLSFVCDCGQKYVIKNRHPDCPPCSGG